LSQLGSRSDLSGVFSNEALERVSTRAQASVSCVTLFRILLIAPYNAQQRRRLFRRRRAQDASLSSP
jgi:hypothetical protein